MKTQLLRITTIFLLLVPFYAAPWESSIEIYPFPYSPQKNLQNQTNPRFVAQFLQKLLRKQDRFLEQLKSVHSLPDIFAFILVYLVNKLSQQPPVRLKSKYFYIAFSQIQKMTMGIDRWRLVMKKRPKKEASKLLGIQHLIFIHAKQLEIDFFAKKCLKPLFLHPSAPI